MPEITRRQILGATTVAVVAGIAVPKPAEAQPIEDPKTALASTYKYRLADAPVEQYNGGTLQRVIVDHFPASPHMSGGLLHLEPGGVREPHWHPNCTEWDSIIAGRVRFSIMDPGGTAETFDVTEGDVIVVPQGYAHYFENVGTEPATLLLTFNVGHFDEVSISEWVAKTPKSSFAVALNLPDGALDNAPNHKLFITSRKNPGK